MSISEQSHSELHTDAGQREILSAIEDVRKRISLSVFLRFGAFSLLVGAGAGLFIQLAAFLIPVYYANLFSALAVGIALVTGLCLSLRKRCTMERAALAMDRFGMAERMITAYENREKSDSFTLLQRRDALNCLRQRGDQVRIPVSPGRRRTVPALCLLAAMILCMFLPSEVKERAGELHDVKREASAKEKEIGELTQVLEELQEAQLTQEQQEKLQEMLESLQASYAEYQQASSAQEIAAASERLDYKYQNMSNQLSQMSRNLAANPSLAPAASSMQNLADQMQDKSPSDEGSQTASNHTGQNDPSGDDQTGSQGQSGNQKGDGADGKNDGKNGSSEDGKDGQGGSENGGPGGDESGAGDGQGGSGDGSTGQNGQDGDQGGSGSSGSGEGGGRGTGSSNTQHDYVSVPNEITDAGNLTGNPTDSEDSDFFRTQNGLSWEGNHISHEAVIGSYEQNAYEGIAAGIYPSGMEEVIKNYFSSFSE